MRKQTLLLGLTLTGISAVANPVVVKMNATSTTMRLAERETGTEIELPAPNSAREYELDLAPGAYVLTGLSKNEKVNGTIVMNVSDSTSVQVRSVITCTAYVSNKDAGGNSWNIENGDYELKVKVNTREGEAIEQTTGESDNAGRYTFLAFNGNSYNAEFSPSDVHRAEGYMSLYRGGTLTANVNVTGAIPQGGEFDVTVPADAGLQIGLKFTHFTDFTAIEPDEVMQADGGKTYRYTLANGQVYNYRTWKEGGLTHGGYFTMSTDPANRPALAFTEEDYARHDPKQVNHSVQSNNGYETGDILLNINPEGHLRLKENDTFLLHAMRMWETTDNSTNNYFIEPDFHYSVWDTDFRPSDAVVEIDDSDHTSAWAKLTARGAGTAIVTVTYDGLDLNYYNKAEKKEYLGGEYWGAIWPENTGVFVVTVGEGESAARPEMVVNEQYNVGTLRLAGKYVDAEHDVFYYLDGEEGFPFTFRPEGVAEVEVASPDVTETEATYSGFGKDGVSMDEEGAYTVMLKKGRNIVRLTDAAGKSVYQVLTAKPCHREITNLTREGSAIFQPGDKIKIQYSGLFHPANKIAGIYNMSAYVTYNGTPNGSSLILGSGQYTFGSAASAQAVTVEIPEDYDAEENPYWVMNEGVIQVNGYGDPIGNHRNTSPLAGRSPNFTAVPHKTYFGSIPDIRIPVTPVRLFDITVDCNVEGAEITLAMGDRKIEADENGKYSGTYGTYSVTAGKEGYRCYRGTYTIGEGDGDSHVIEVAMTEGPEGMWDGKTVTAVEPDESGDYHISNGAELAYLSEAAARYGKNLTARIALDSDIDLGDYDWSPIGPSSSNPFAGRFDGQGHTVTGIYIDRPNDNNMGLFGYVKGTADSPAEIKNVTAGGYVCGKQYVGGIAACLNTYASISHSANMADVRSTTANSYAGGVVGYISTGTGVTVEDCYNHGDIEGQKYVGGVAGYNNASAIIRNIYSIGAVCGDAATTGACVGSTQSKDNVSNAFAIEEYGVTAGHILVTEGQMASGEVAYRLGDAFRQTLGRDAYPGFEGLPVYYDEANDLYYNEEPPTVDVDSITGIPATSTADVYDLTGRMVLRDAGEEALRRLQPGIYVVRSGTAERKVLVR